MEINKRKIKRLIFSAAETIIILLLGLALEVEVRHLAIIMLVFLISKSAFGSTLHFKSWYRCLVWSSLVMLSLFVILKIDLVLSILFAIFSAFIMTGRANICELYFWKNNGEPSKYQDIQEFIKYNSFDDRLLEFENKLEKQNSVEYLIYKYRFKDGKTFGEISELLDMDGPRVVERLDKVAFALRLYCRI